MASATCGWCGVLTYMRPVGEIVRLPDHQTGYDSTAYSRAFQCEKCRNFSIGHIDVGRSLMTHEAVTTFESARTRWTPQDARGKDFPFVPDTIASAADEAHRCFSFQAYRACASIARAVLESTAKAKGVTKGSISNKIDALAEARHIRQDLAEAAHEVRLAGNEVAHGDIDVEPLSAEEAEDILQIMDDVLEEIFQAPARITRVRANRAARRAAASPQDD